MGQIMESGTVGDDYKYYTISQLPSCILGLLLLRWINFIYVYFIIGYVNKIFGVLHMDLLLAPQSVELMYRCALLYFWMSQSLLLVKDNYFRYLMYNYQWIYNYIPDWNASIFGASLIMLDWTCHNGTLLYRVCWCIPTMIICMDVSGFVTGCPCGFCYRKLISCSSCVGPLFVNKASINGLPQ